MNDIIENAFFDELHQMAKEAGVVPLLAGVGQALRAGGSALGRGGTAVLGGKMGVGHAAKRVGQAVQAGFTRGATPLGKGVAGPLTGAQLGAQHTNALIGGGALAAGALGAGKLLSSSRQPGAGIAGY